MAKKKKSKKTARKTGKKKKNLRKKIKLKKALKNKKIKKSISVKKRKLKKKTIKNKKKVKKPKRAAPKKKRPVSHGARKTLSTAHEIHGEARVGPEGQAFEGFDQAPAPPPERVSALDGNVRPVSAPQENPEERVPSGEEGPAEDPDAETFDDLKH